MLITRTNVAKPEWTYNICGLTALQMHRLIAALDDRVRTVEAALIRDLKAALETNGNKLGDSHTAKGSGK